ncbi:MAG: L,D-transpeptidase family protein, partial [Egibacteraceae bacterium]
RPLIACQVRQGGHRRWVCAERELKRQGYHVGRADGRVGPHSVWAIYAFEKVARRKVRGTFTNGDWRKMVRRPRYKVRRPGLPDDHVEINIARQLIVLVRNGKARYFAHTSTGKPSTPTVRGTFSVYEKRPYYQPWNDMYKAIFFYRGYAMHGYPKVPTYPASHGCARTYNRNQDWLYPKISYGERVAVY